MMPACEHDEKLLARHDCQGDNRRIHALVIGVGRYSEAAPRYGTSLDSLPGAALAAYRFAHYLINEFQHQEPDGRRLATLRLMLSPLERELATVQDLRPKPAERKEVSVALQDWAEDCNTDPQNLAVLYVAGHGVALGKSTSLLFLADAPTERSLALAAVNLTLTEDRMSDCAAKNNLFFYDCCAVPPGAIPHHQESALAITEFPVQKDSPRRIGLVCVNAARVGTRTFAIGEDGTLLARGLLGNYRDRAGDDALLRIAGDLSSTKHGFGITPSSLSEMLSPRLQEIADERNAPKGYEATLTGRLLADPITVPDPTPEFKVTLKGLRSGRTSPVAVTLENHEGELIPLSTDGDDVEVTVPAGNYWIQISGSGRRPTPLQVTGPVEWEVPT